MGFFDRFKTPKAYTGVVVKKGVHTSSDGEGDADTSYTVSVKIDSEDGVPRERTIYVSRDIYNKTEVGNEVIKTVDDKRPVIQLGTKRAAN